MSRLIYFFGGWMTLAVACAPAASPNEEAKPAASPDRIVATHENGNPKQVYRYTGKDSLNRFEIAYHPEGQLLSEGQVINGQRDGEWRSYHVNGQLWSLHHYSNGLQQGEYRVFYPDGTPRIEGRYINDNKSGEWIFFTEAGDTAKVVVFD